MAVDNELELCKNIKYRLHQLTVSIRNPFGTWSAIVFLEFAL